MCIIELLGTKFYIDTHKHLLFTSSSLLVLSINNCSFLIIFLSSDISISESGMLKSCALIMELPTSLCNFCFIYFETTS